MSEKPTEKSSKRVSAAVKSTAPGKLTGRHSGGYTPFGYINVQGFLGLGDEFIAAIIGGLLEGCNIEDRDLVLQRTIDADRCHDALNERQVSGVVLHAYPDHPIVNVLAASGIPIVAICDAISEFPSVVVDDAAGARTLAHYLSDRGYKRVLYRRRRHEIETGKRRFEGFMEVAVLRDLNVTITMVEDDFILYPEEIAYLNDTQNHPCAVTGWRDLSMMAVAKFCRESGLRVPDDVALAGFDGMSMVPQVSGVLTTIVAPWSELAKTSVSVLSSLLQKKQVPRETIIPVRLRIGDTT
jgi:LacI family transcriptional regulator